MASSNGTDANRAMLSRKSIDRISAVLEALQRCTLHHDVFNIINFQHSFFIIFVISVTNHTILQRVEIMVRKGIVLSVSWT